jgi:four helix bundle protein
MRTADSISNKVRVVGLKRSSAIAVARHHSGMSHFGPAISHETANDPLFRMRAYRLASDLLEVAWDDAKALSAEPVTERIAGQLYAAVNSITANLGEGYSRSSGRDRARLFEYALGSVRESISWYQGARPALGDVVRNRLDSLEEIRRILIAIIPRERASGIPRTKT